LLFRSPAADIKRIRNNLNLSQSLFSELLGVSVKTVEAWEAGRNVPVGPAQRMLGLLEKKPELLNEYMLIKTAK
jgi:putative transcriptional regulator